MIDTRCFENGHIKNEAFLLLESEKLNADERLALSRHLASCDACTQNYLELLTEDSLLDIPDGLNEKILKNTTGRINMEKSGRFKLNQLLKLTAAAVLAISFYSTGVFNYFYNTSYMISNNIPQNEQLARIDSFDFGKRLNNEFSKFSNKINKLNGDGLYEKK